MMKSSWLWIWFAVLLALDLVIPRFALKGVVTFSGAFLFWVGWVAVAIASMFTIFLKWKE